MQIGYGILMDGEVFNFMRKIELLLQKEFGLEMGLKQSPHVTVKPPFEVNDLTPYIDYLDKLGFELSKFNIHFKGFNSFGKKVIYLDVMRNERLFEIYRKIVSDLQLDENDMIFHGTLAYGDINEDQFERAIELLNSRFQPEFNFIAKKIALFYQLPENCGWIVLKEISLKNN